MSRKWLYFLCTAAALFAADPPRKTFPFPYTQEDLPNGLRLVTVPAEFPNIVSVFVVVLFFFQAEDGIRDNKA